jgi:uncharacterized RDD family membrane protein YckC
MTEPWPPIEEGWEHRSEPDRPYGPYAGFGVRFLGSLIDGLILNLANSLIVGITDGFGKTNGELFGMRWTTYLISLVVGIAYTAYFLGSPSGQTVGMRVMQIRVVDAETGGRVDYGRCVTRYFVAIVSGLAFLLGYFWMLWDPHRQTWHDRAAGTVVVPVEAYPVERWPG